MEWPGAAGNIRALADAAGSTQRRMPGGRGDDDGSRRLRRTMRSSRPGQAGRKRKGRREVGAFFVGAPIWPGNAGLLRRSGAQRLASMGHPPRTSAAMPVDSELRSLEIAIPAQPDSLVKLSLLLAEEEINLGAIAALIEGDMALAAAVMKAVNSSLYGL